MKKISDLYTVESVEYSARSDLKSENIGCMLIMENKKAVAQQRLFGNYGAL